MGQLVRLGSGKRLAPQAKNDKEKTGKSFLDEELFPFCLRLGESKTTGRQPHRFSDPNRLSRLRPMRRSAKLALPALAARYGCLPSSVSPTASLEQWDYRIP